MKRIICLFLSFALWMSCFAFSVYANEGVDDESGIVEALRAAESVKVQFELSSVDFENLTTSDHIFAYEYTNTGCVYNSEFIPIKYENELVGWVIKTAFDGECFYQFTTAFVTEVNDNLDLLDEFAVIYDKQASYLYNGADLIKLGDTAITIDTRAEVSEGNLVDAPIVLNNIDANYRLEYTTYMPSNRTSSVVSCNVNFVSQNPPSCLCWAASTACIVNYLQRTNYDANIIAMGWLGTTNYNQTLDPGLEDDVLARYGVYYTHRFQRPSESVIRNNIANGYPILATFDVGGEDYQYHDVVIYGINTTEHHLYVMDPEYGFAVASPTTYGTHYYISVFTGKPLILDYATCKYWTS